LAGGPDAADPGDGEAVAEGPLPHELVDFAHESERQLAQLLDFYGIEWRYEPDTFVLERDADGQPTLAFTPDFHLPAHGVYLEVTTLRQKLVTKKNRKVRRLLELHPELVVRILYQRDVVALLVRYGLAAPEALAGYGPLAPAGEAGESLLGLGVLANPPGSAAHRH
jgi:hypothetical protein